MNPQHLPDTSDVLVKPWYLSRTVWLNILGALILVLGIILDNATTLALPPQVLAYFGVLMAILNGLLRFQTYQPVGTKREIVRMDNRAIKRELGDQ